MLGTMLDVKNFVNNNINTKLIAVFAKSYCPYCKNAIAALDFVPDTEKNIIMIENHPNMSQIQDYLNELTGARSVPRVFIGGKFFGGGDQTVAAKNNGSLQKLYEEAKKS